MRASLLIAFASVVAMSAGASYAQSAASTDATATDSTAAVAPATSDQAYASSDTLGDSSKLKAGDDGVVSNGPVPDTKANRQAYGRPLSHAGRATAPAGN